MFANVNFEYDPKTQSVLVIQLMESFLEETQILDMGLLIAPLSIICTPYQGKKTSNWHIKQSGGHDFKGWVSALNILENQHQNNKFERWGTDTEGTLIRGVSSVLDLDQIFDAVDLKLSITSNPVVEKRQLLAS